MNSSYAQHSKQLLVKALLVCACGCFPFSPAVSIAKTLPAAASLQGPSARCPEFPVGPITGNWRLLWTDKEQGLDDDGGLEEHTGKSEISADSTQCVFAEHLSISPERNATNSFAYDSTGKRWMETWIDNAGYRADFPGVPSGKDVVFIRRLHQQNGDDFVERWSLENCHHSTTHENQRFDRLLEESKDGGKPWRLMWDLHYERP